jgi:hypothetical protein
MCRTPDRHARNMERYFERLAGATADTQPSERRDRRIGEQVNPNSLGGSLEEPGVSNSSPRDDKLNPFTRKMSTPNEQRI